MVLGLLAFGCARDNPDLAVPGEDLAVSIDLGVVTAGDLAGGVDLASQAIEDGGLPTEEDGGGIVIGGSDGGGADLASAVQCGDGKCQGGETCSTCAADCGGCVCADRTADCDGQPGCEVDVNASDPGEAENNLCAGATNLGQVDEGMTLTSTVHRILPEGDLDTFSVLLHEVPHLCLSGTQSFRAIVTVSPPSGSALSLRLPAGDSCDDTWGALRPVGACFSWPGACLVNDDRTALFQIVGGASCGFYKLEVTMCAEGAAQCCTSVGCC
jgi:hypothetical protein